MAPRLGSRASGRIDRGQRRPDTFCPLRIASLPMRVSAASTTLTAWTTSQREFLRSTGGCVAPVSTMAIRQLPAQQISTVLAHQPWRGCILEPRGGRHQFSTAGDIASIMSSGTSGTVMTNRCEEPWRVVDERAHRAQRMILGDTLLSGHVTEHRGGSSVISSHARHGSTRSTICRSPKLKGFSASS
jgi:hypothetical protein